MTRFPNIRTSLIYLGALSAAACSTSGASQTNGLSTVGAAGATGTPPAVAGASAAGTTAAGARAAAGTPATAGVPGVATAAGSSALAGASGAGLAGAAGSITAGASGAAANGPPTFTVVYADVILAAGCGTGAYCHASDAGGKLKMLDQDSTYTALVGVKAMGSTTPSTSGAAGASSVAGAGGTSAAGRSGGAGSTGTAGSVSSAGAAASPTANCVDTGLFRVKAGDPDNSLLVHKLEGTQTCGTAMPPGGMLSAAQLSAVRAWIKAGAMNN
jgi:hypothetical protein